MAGQTIGRRTRFVRVAFAVLGAATPAVPANAPAENIDQIITGALGDHAPGAITSERGSAQFQRALDMGARAAPVRYLLGAALSLQRRDDDAIAAWEKATAEGLPKPITAPLIASTRLARGDAAGAAAAMAATDVTAGDATAAKILAATRIAAQREREAIDTLDRDRRGRPSEEKNDETHAIRQGGAAIGGVRSRWLFEEG